jgi:hypothetical protein
MSYATVILARNIYAHRIEFRPGPYTLGRWQKLINAITCAWVFFISVVLLFPTVRPVTAANMNYAVTVAGFIGIFSLGWWWAGARKYVLFSLLCCYTDICRTYTGPRTQHLLQVVPAMDGSDQYPYDDIDVTDSVH